MKIILFLFFTLILLASQIGLIPQSGLLRFIPTMTMLLFVSAFLFERMNSTKTSTNGIVKIVCLWLGYVLIHAVLLPNKEGVILTMLASSFWCFYFLLACLLYKKCAKQILQKLVNWFSLICIICILGLLYSLNHSVVSDRLIGNNEIFYSLLCLPWLMLIKSPRNRFFMVVLIVICAAVSLKRSAMIISLLSLGVVFYMRFIEGKRFKIVPTIILVCVVSIIYSFISESQNVVNIVSRFNSIEDDNGSGRMGIYEMVWLLITKSSQMDLILGHGFNSVIVSIGFASAHNDFLEIIYDFGIIGIIIYVSFHLALIKRCISLKKQKSEYFESYLVSYIIFFVMSMVSHLIIYPTYFIILCAYWAFVECNFKQKQ